MGTSGSKSAPLKPREEALDFQAFMGSWFVIACKPTYFEKGAHNAKEVYEWNEKKKQIDITFTFNKDSFDGKLSKIPQVGWVHNQSKTEWRISPFWPLKLPYIILETVENQYCVIG